MTDPARRKAVAVLGAVLPARGDGESLRAALERERGGLDGAGQGLMADLAFGVCRHYRLLDTWLTEHLDKPLRAKARPVQLALLAGLYEVWFTERAHHAVVNAWPDVCRGLGAPWAAGLCNAILRRATREPLATMLESRPPPVRYSLPDWLWQHWQSDWGEQAEPLARASIAEPPLAVRVNRLRTDVDTLVTRLEAAGFTARPGALAPDCLYIEPPRPVDQLPGFREGLFSVQDEAAQLPATLMDAPRDGRLLDACAAPGGKTAQLAELFPEARLTALELEDKRLTRVRGNLERLGHQARLLRGDATRPEDWWDGTPFDAVLVDAPCSATGILRRQPDGKWHRRAADIERLAGLQARMLAALWPLVSPGGVLVYATCSVLKRENEEQVRRFLADHDTARDDTPAFAGAVPSDGGCQLLPDRASHDGFYFARLRKGT